MQKLKYISDFFNTVSILTLIIVLLWVPGSIKSPIFSRYIGRKLNKTDHTPTNHTRNSLKH